ncbi:unnamed protein product [Mytilus coruscus]|uniref:Uncharacterized protein n=1 Tax=Mytilus coruscus TaxID=42192 RepID=A0A6J8CED6_MYTCO|nr:unnamed protein product [Mytilus coruscus]
MVAYRIKRNRLEAWIRVLGILYYEHFGKKAELYQVDWYDDPHQWEGEGNKAICIDLTIDKQLLYKITLFISTGVLQAQGLSKDLFMTRDIPTLIALVNSVCAHNHTSVNTDIDSTCKSSDNTVSSMNSTEESTSVKSVINSNASSTDNKLTDSNNNTQTHIQFYVPTYNITDTTMATQAKISIGYDDLNRPQSSFVEALAGITKSQPALIVQAERSFSDLNSAL